MPYSPRSPTKKTLPASPCSSSVIPSAISTVSFVALPSADLCAGLFSCVEPLAAPFEPSCPAATPALLRLRRRRADRLVPVPAPAPPPPSRLEPLPALLPRPEAVPPPLKAPALAAASFELSLVSSSSFEPSGNPMRRCHPIPCRAATPAVVVARPSHRNPTKSAGRPDGSAWGAAYARGLGADPRAAPGPAHGPPRAPGRTDRSSARRPRSAPRHRGPLQADQALVRLPRRQFSPSPLPTPRRYRAFLVRFERERG